MPARGSNELLWYSTLGGVGLLASFALLFEILAVITGAFYHDRSASAICSGASKACGGFIPMILAAYPVLKDRPNTSRNLRERPNTGKTSNGRRI
jgi:hypothetical protein